MNDDFNGEEFFLKCEVSPCYRTTDTTNTFMFFRKRGNIVEGCYANIYCDGNSGIDIPDELDKLDEKYSSNFLADLSKIDFSSWKKPKDYMMGCDGESWSFQLKFPSKRLKKLYLWEHFPANFSELENLFAKYFKLKELQRIPPRPSIEEIERRAREFLINLKQNQEQ